MIDICMSSVPSAGAAYLVALSHYKCCSAHLWVKFKLYYYTESQEITNTEKNFDPEIAEYFEHSSG